MKKLLLIASSAILQYVPSTAQDIYFTQYLTSPMTLNPALTGLVPQDFRITANYRNQWTAYSPEAYTTRAVSFDMCLLKGKLPKGDALGVGAMTFYDRSYDGALKNSTSGVSVAYHKALGSKKQQHISVGFQTQYVQKNLDNTKLFFGSPTLLPVELHDQARYADYNMGLVYSGKIGSGSTIYGGYSYYHFTQPMENLLGNIHQVHNRQTLHAGGAFDVDKNIILYANALYQTQASAQALQLGGSGGFVLNHNKDVNKNTIFYVGGWYRHEDVVAPYLAIEWSGVRLGLSYDVNVSSLSPAYQSRNSLELSLTCGGMIGSKRTNADKWMVPKM